MSYTPYRNVLVGLQQSINKKSRSIKLRLSSVKYTSVFSYYIVHGVAAYREFLGDCLIGDPIAFYTLQDAPVTLVMNVFRDDMNQF